MSPEIQAIIDSQNQKIEKLTARLDEFYLADRIRISNKDIELSTTRGTKIGTKATQKLAFYGVTPVTQYSAHFNGSASGSYGSTEQNIINGIQAALKTYGLIIG